MTRKNQRSQTDEAALLQEEYWSQDDASLLWAMIRSRTCFNRRLATKAEAAKMKYNRRLLYLLAVAVFGRAQHLVKHRTWHNLLRIAEAYAEGQATQAQVAKVYDQYERIPISKLQAPAAAAVQSVHFMLDDYKLIEGVGFVSDAAGYLSAIEAGDLLKRATIDLARYVWERPAFRAGRKQEEQAICAIIRDIFGNPFGPVPVLKSAWVAWNDGTIVKMAQRIYDKRDFDRLPILADALEDAGCDNKELLQHCRSDGPHVRGCWALDLILAKT